MTDFQSPGIDVSERRGSPVSAPSISPGVAAFQGVAEKGPVNSPVLVYGPDDAEEVFGGFIPGSSLLHEVNAFFNNGGERCYINRIVHYTDVSNETTGTAVAAKQTLTNGTTETLDVAASSPGLFGNLLRVSTFRVDTVVAKVGGVVAAGVAASIALSSVLRVSVGDTIKIVKGGDTQRAVVTSVDPITKKVTLSPSITVPNGGYDGTESVTVETFNLSATDKDGVTSFTFRNLRMSALAGENYVENKINNTPRAPFAVDRLALEVSATVDNRPSNQTNTLLGGTVAGVDGGTITDADYVGSKAGGTGLYAFDNIDDFLLGPITPGVTTATVVKGLEAYVEGRQDVFSILDLPQGVLPVGAVSTLQQTWAIATSYVAVYYPWVRAPDALTGGPSSFPPSGYVAGMYARTFKKRNFGKAPAGIEDGKLFGVTGLDYEVKKPAYDVLYPANINAIQKKKNAGYCVMGSRTLDTLGDFRQIPVRLVFLVVKRQFLEGTEFSLFETPGKELWSRITRYMSLYLRGLREAKILDGDNDNEAFFVQCDERNNTASVRRAGKVRCRIGLNVGDTAEFIEITLERDTRKIDAELAAEVG